MTEPTLVVAPSEGQQDERLSIRVEGLRPGVRLVLRTRVRNMFGPWESTNTYVARADGAVDLDRQAPVEGTYRGIDVMGPVLSARWASPDTLAPPQVRDIANPNSIEFSATADGEEIGSVTCVRRYIAPFLRRTDVREDGIVGTLFEYDDDVARPAIVMMGGSAPMIPEHIAAPMAAHGFTVLAISFFGMGGGTPDELGEVPLEYFANCARYLLARPTATGPRVGLFGASKGGEASPLVAASFPDLIGAVVAEAASGYVGCGMKRDDHGKLLTNWTLDGEGLDYISPTDEAVAAYLAGDADTPQSIVPLWESGLADEAAAARAEIPVENADCPILYLNGSDDMMWPAHRMTAPSLRRTAEVRYPHAVEEVVFQGCGHVLHPPYGPVDVPALKHPVSGMTNAYGGTVEGTSRASVEHWSRMIDFWHEHLGKR